MPSVSLSYSTSYAGPELSDLNNSWSTRLSLNWPLFNGFTRETNVARTSAARRAAEARVGDARRQAASQLTQQLAALESAEARIGIAQASRAAAEEDLRVQKERYRLGVATIVDVLTSQVNLNQAEVNLIQARLDFQLAKAQIEALAGHEL
jgi:outer membrane protein TolC